MRVAQKYLATSLTMQRSEPPRLWRRNLSRDPIRRRQSTGAHKGCAFFAYADNYLIDIDHRLRPACQARFLSSSPISRGGQAKGKSSAEGRLERASESPSSDPTRDLTAPAMAIGSNPLSSTKKSAQIDVIS
jgi:hypothetical protein